jgi:Holliday junction resolvase
MTDGSTAERELSAMLEERGFAVMRALASTPEARLTPDIVAGKQIEAGVPGANPTRHLAFTVKQRIADWPQNVHIAEDELRKLRQFARRMGATPYVTIRPNQRRSEQDWHFVSVADSRLGRTDDGSYVIRQADLPAPSLTEVTASGQ